MTSEGGTFADDALKVVGVSLAASATVYAAYRVVTAPKRGALFQASQMPAHGGDLVAEVLGECALTSVVRCHYSCRAIQYSCTQGSLCVHVDRVSERESVAARAHRAHRRRSAADTFRRFSWDRKRAAFVSLMCVTKRLRSLLPMPSLVSPMRSALRV